MTSMGPVAVVAVVAGLYAVALAVLARLVRPIRVELDMVGRRLMASADLSSNWKAAFAQELRQATSPSSLVLSVMLLPVVLLLVVMRVLPGDPFAHLDDLKVRGDAERFRDLVFISKLAANPLFGCIYVAELAIAAPIAALLGPRRSGRVVPFAVVEAGRALLRRPQPLFGPLTPRANAGP